MSKSTRDERNLVKSIVASLTIKRISEPEPEIIKAIFWRIMTNLKRSVLFVCGLKHILRRSIFLTGHSLIYDCGYKGSRPGRLIPSFRTVVVPYQYSEILNNMMDRGYGWSKIFLLEVQQLFAV